MIALLSELAQANRHAFVALARLGAVGATEIIPPGQVKAEVRVQLRTNYRVVNAVHIWSDEKQPEHSVYCEREPDVGVVEHCHAVEHDFEGKHRKNGGPE